MSGFKLNKESLLKSAICPPGMTKGELVKVGEQYVSAKGATVQQADFETEKGYSVSVWFNDKVMANLFEFVAAADKVTFDPDNMQETEIDLKDYLHKPVVFNVSHRKTDDGKVVAQIDNFYSADKVPF